MKTINGISIDGNEMTLDMTILLGVDNVHFEIKQALLNYAKENATSLMELTSPNMKVLASNMPKVIGLSEMPDTMTGAELHANNANAEAAEAILMEMTTESERLSFVPNDGIIRETIQRLHPNITDTDLSNIFVATYDAHRYDCDWVQHIDTMLDLVLATKKQYEK